jgi:hypothetical protein
MYRTFRFLKYFNGSKETLTSKFYREAAKGTEGIVKNLSTLNTFNTFCLMMNRIFQYKIVTVNSFPRYYESKTPLGKKLQENFQSNQ